MEINISEIRKKAFESLSEERATQIQEKVMGNPDAGNDPVFVATTMAMEMMGDLVEEMLKQYHEELMKKISK